MSERLLVDGATKGVKNVLVYLSKPTSVSDEAKKAASATHVLFDQKNCVFVPHVLGILNGIDDHAQVKRSGEPQHQRQAQATVHSISCSLRRARRSSLRAGPERTPAEVTCDIHPWMKAWWMVFDHPYFAVTDAKGYFEIKNAPAGTQKVVVWQEAVERTALSRLPRATRP